jgi:uncharacterized SAM-binding protein YcdF (DUF218 family)
MKSIGAPIGQVGMTYSRIGGFVADPLPRGLALFFGGFALLNLLGSLRVARFDENLWWIDLRWLPAVAANLIIAIAAVCLVFFGVRPPRSSFGKNLVVACAATLGIIALVNAANFFLLLLRRDVSSSVPLPLSLLVAFSMLLILRAALKAKDMPPSTSWPALGVCAGCLLVFPLLQMFCFGKTDYRRVADVAVVPGCRVYADGRPSDALKDRVRTACQLYHDRLTRKLLFSGGPGDGTTSEVESMKKMAMQLGVRSEDILLDDKGLNTQATVRNSKPILKSLNASRVLVVSHFYHLPRIKLAYQRAGLEVYTVPARESYLLRQMPYNMAREVAALWVYYARPLARPAS